MKKWMLFLTLCISLPFIGLPENAGGPAWNAAGGSAVGRRTSGCAAFL